MFQDINFIAAFVYSLGFRFGFTLGVKERVNGGGGGGKPKLPIGGGGSNGGAERPRDGAGGGGGSNEGGGGGGGGNADEGWICISCFDVSNILVIFLTLLTGSG